MTPLPRWMAPGRWLASHSRSSRTSTRWNDSPRSSRPFTSWTLHSLTTCFASWTSFKKPDACCLPIDELQDYGRMNKDNGAGFFLFMLPRSSDILQKSADGGVDRVGIL